MNKLQTESLTEQQFCEGLELIWVNFKSFNAKGSAIVHAAKNMSEWQRKTSEPKSQGLKLKNMQRTSKRKEENDDETAIAQAETLCETR